MVIIGAVCTDGVLWTVVVMRTGMLPAARLLVALVLRICSGPGLFSRLGASNANEVHKQVSVATEYLSLLRTWLGEGDNALQAVWSLPVSVLRLSVGLDEEDAIQYS